MKYNIFINLGWNVSSSSKDTDHPFNMIPYFEKYKNKYWSKNVRLDERTRSTPYYEVMKAVDKFVNIKNINSDDISFCFGRGAFGSTTEKFMNDKLRKLNGEKYSFNIVVAKSFGVIDSLKVIKENPNINIDLFIAIDGKSPFWSWNGVVDLYNKKELSDDLGDHRQRERLKCYGNIKKYYSIVQRKAGLKGYLFGKPQSILSDYNYIVKYIENKVYDHYSDGYKRHLDIHHNTMEEITAINKCCKYRSKMLTVPELITEFLIDVSI